jgi:signal transduction histidine kinase
MPLGDFIYAHHEEIIRAFAEFAGTLMPAGVNMTDAELRDHAEELLTAIVLDMRAAQSGAEQSRKSKGSGAAQAMAPSGQLHADARLQHGFSLQSVVAEFRGLRATVLRLYDESGATDLGEVRRFNEAIDEALTVSLTRFAVRTDLFRDQFVGILSHDLRTPLGAITTGAALLAVPEDNVERRARVASRILTSAQRMKRMIADLLDLTRARLGGGIPLTRRRTNLHHVCDEVIAEIHEAHRASDVRFTASGSLLGEWDPDRLAQVVSNLLTNAIQHGDGHPVTLTVREAPGGVTLVVHNGGARFGPRRCPLSSSRWLVARLTARIRHRVSAWACSSHARSSWPTAGPSTCAHRQTRGRRSPCGSRRVLRLAPFDDLVVTFLKDLASVTQQTRSIQPVADRLSTERQDQVTMTRARANPGSQTARQRLRVNRTGFVGGLFQREDGAHGTTKQVLTGGARAGGADGLGARARARVAMGGDSVGR